MLLDTVHGLFGLFISTRWMRNYLLFTSTASNMFYGEVIVMTVEDSLGILNTSNTDCCIASFKVNFMNHGHLFYRILDKVYSLLFCKMYYNQYYNPTFPIAKFKPYVIVITQHNQIDVVHSI